MTALPPYTYIPGKTPHPVHDPRGHAYGVTHSPVTDFNPQHAHGHERWQNACQLFEAGYYWEAHEAWESLWHAVGRSGPAADCLKGLIKWAAAGVKAREGRLEGVQRHCRRAAELLCPFAAAPPITGLDVLSIVKRIDAAAALTELPTDSAIPVQPFPEWTLMSSSNQSDP